MEQLTLDSAPASTIGERWYIWRRHWTIDKERHADKDGVREFQVRLIPDDRGKTPRNRYPFVAYWRVQRYGRPSGY